MLRQLADAVFVCNVLELTADHAEFVGLHFSICGVRLASIQPHSVAHCWLYARVVLYEMAPSIHHAVATGDVLQVGQVDRLPVDVEHVWGEPVIRSGVRCTPSPGRKSRSQ